MKRDYEYNNENQTKSTSVIGSMTNLIQKEQNLA